MLNTVITNCQEAEAAEFITAWSFPLNRQVILYDSLWELVLAFVSMLSLYCRLNLDWVIVKGKNWQILPSVGQSRSHNQPVKGHFTPKKFLQKDSNK